MDHQHYCAVSLQWTGNNGSGTTAYTAYERSHTIAATSKPDLLCSSDAAFRGDEKKYNPEELLVDSLSSCHMLWYLHLCMEAGVVVTAYTDDAKGTLVVTADGGGHFTEVTLNRVVTITDKTMEEKEKALHSQANHLCFIARSCNFPVHHVATIQINDSQSTQN